MKKMYVIEVVLQILVGEFAWGAIHFSSSKIILIKGLLY